MKFIIVFPCLITSWFIAVFLIGSILHLVHPITREQKEWWEEYGQYYN